MKNKEQRKVRKSNYSEENKKKMVIRLNNYDDVINQIASIESALNGVKQILMESHLKSCVLEQIHDGKDEVIDELLKTIRRLMH
jgi:DNA-binding FrmR family transcriptional regulator